MQDDAGRCKTHIYWFLCLVKVLYYKKYYPIFATSTGEEDVVRPDDKTNLQIINSSKIKIMSLAQNPLTGQMHNQWRTL